MTAQIPDTIDIDGSPHALAAVDGDPLFDPVGHDVFPGPFHTGCHRGYVCGYSIADDRLTLRELVLGQHATVAGRPISPGATVFGASVTEDAGDGSYTAAPLSVHVPFSGRLLAGRGIIEHLHVDMGFAPGWRYARVVEVVLDAGHVVARVDRSAEVAAVRDAVLDGVIPDPDGDPRGAGWVRRTFTLTYDRTFPPTHR
ncbi:hypothetical protein SAMN05421874_103255 [Nonomuraea maritima]|uniref:Uncharacterized protein n=1 Tax=Nonomuraea maritima TaxID=683260 RepID=A0A1G8WRI9_9ACTN|nr:hypothetical protein [Nonomuraea maritima]SDJ80220.1 hypothetical protein SAMN05421874_103255 [Nonomuraea maritima]